MRFRRSTRGLVLAALLAGVFAPRASAQVSALGGRYEPYALSAALNAFTNLYVAYLNENSSNNTAIAYTYAYWGYANINYAVNTTLPMYRSGTAPWSQYYTFLQRTYQYLYYAYVYSYKSYQERPGAYGQAAFMYAYYGQAYTLYSLYSPQIAPPASNTNDGLDAELRALRDLHNNTRVANGLGQLTSDQRLNNAALAHAQWMAANQNMTHTESDGSQPIDRAERYGYSGSSYGVGENIAYGYSNINDVFTAWMNSDGHRHNILNGQYQNIGIAVATASNGSRYWCVVFGYIQ